MAKHLVIVESPAKAKTINKYLGRDYLVKSSFGHIRDLPSGGESEESEAKAKPVKKKAKPSADDKAARAQAALVRRMGVDPEHGWAARYEVSPGKEKVVAELRAAAEKAEQVWLASDLDREGEAIAWHLRELLGGDPARFRRVTFSEITKKAIQESFANPGQVNQDRVDAQQARRFLDRVVGFMVSPLLWQKVARGLSAGRVQSVAVRLIVEREREIHRFRPEEFWEIHADLKGAAGALRALAVRHRGQALKIGDRAAADAAVAALRAAAYRVAGRDDKPARSFPNPPFITSSLQAAASTRLGFSVKKTMTLAQRLYEAGHITYMRTDSVNISADALVAVRTLIGERFGARYLPEKAIAYRSKEGAQEAHEAVRPTDLRLDAESLDAESDAKRLYDLIWRQFVACQMPPAEFDTSTVTVAAGDYELRANGRVLRFDGFFKVLPPAKSDDQQLPALSVGDALDLVKLDPSQHFTKPPPRYSEAGLVKEMEKRGIGRPSTYASIISTIQDRGYVKLADRRFFAEKLGEVVTGRLQAAFPDLMDYDFTRGLEGQLDEIAEAKAGYRAVLDRFYAGFRGRLDQASAAMQKAAVVPTPVACPTCARPMGVRTARTGVFLSCTGYDLPAKERCTATLNVVPGLAAVAVKESQGEEDEASEAEARALTERRRCPRCGTAMDAWLVDEHRRLHVCGANPDCPGIELEEGTFQLPAGAAGVTHPCTACAAGTMELRDGRFGKYYKCKDCSVIVKPDREGKPRPPAAKPVPMPELKCTKGEGHFVLRDGLSGLFLAASTYPRLKETRNPLVADLRRHADELDPKFRYLLDAPDADPDGNPAVIRFSRKTRQQYLASEKDGKATGWSLWCEGGRWVPRAATEEDDKPARRPRKGG